MLEGFVKKKIRNTGGMLKNLPSEIRKQLEKISGVMKKCHL